MASRFAVTTRESAIGMISQQSTSRRLALARRERRFRMQYRMRVSRLTRRTPEGISPFRACIRDMFDASREDGISNQNLCGDRYLVLISSYLLMPDGHVPADYSLLSVLQLSDHLLQYHFVTPGRIFNGIGARVCWRGSTLDCRFLRNSLQSFLLTFKSLQILQNLTFLEISCRSRDR